ncbi:MAG: phosphatidate cytidylyltransferase [Christensenellales bacterium]|nr:phosphatidate cytidylyltransferase [Clostridia bacterium]MDY4083754.1 phosphatidate cytidylyltransferase [Eubacteriales bacterium]
MWKRIATAVVLLGIVLGTLLGLRQIEVAFADLVGVLVCVLGVYEMYNALKQAGYSPVGLALFFSAATIYPATYFLGEKGIIASVLLAVMIAIVYFTFSKRLELKDLFATIGVIVYPVLLFSPFFVLNHSQYGMLAIMLTLLVPILTDTMAYFVGITFKGPKLCPTISPKKTISGAIGGVLGGILGAMIVFVLFDYTQCMSAFKNVGMLTLTDSLVKSGIIYAVIGLVGGVICELGDLGASSIKRKAGIKDFGKIFPGHGGMMDRLDSILFMLPIVYVTISLITR